MLITTEKKMKKIVSNTDQNFLPTLIEFIDKLENKEEFDYGLYNILLSYSLNEGELNKMIENVKIFSHDDEDKEEVNFPYEDWIDRITSKISLQ